MSKAFHRFWLPIVLVLAAILVASVGLVIRTRHADVQTARVSSPEFNLDYLHCTDTALYWREQPDSEVEMVQALGYSPEYDAVMAANLVLFTWETPGGGSGSGLLEAMGEAIQQECEQGYGPIASPPPAPEPRAPSPVPTSAPLPSPEPCSPESGGGCPADASASAFIDAMAAGDREEALVFATPDVFKQASIVAPSVWSQVDLSGSCTVYQPGTAADDTLVCYLEGPSDRPGRLWLFGVPEAGYQVTSIDLRGW